MPDDVASPLIAHARSQSIGDLLRRSAARDPDKTAIVYRGLRQTYAELDATVNRTASSLAARGIGPGRPGRASSATTTTRSWSPTSRWPGSARCPCPSTSC